MISLILVMIAGALNAVMDKLAFNFNTSVFKDLNPVFWDVKQSWKNMWKWPLQPFEGKYYFGLYKPRWKEKFPYSSTILVGFIDAWHLAKALMVVCLGAAVALHTPFIAWWVDSLVMVSMFTGTFTYFYEYVLTSNKK